MSRTATFLLVVLLALGGLAALFSVQNAQRTLMLSLDLGFAAWQLREPVPAPALIGASFGIGFLLGGLLVSIRAVRLAGRVRALEQQIAVSAFSSPRASGRSEPGLR